MQQSEKKKQPPFAKMAKLLEHAKLAFQYDMEPKYIAPYFPRKPHVINLLANDICNSQCKMCFIWKQKRDKEFTPEELHQILRDPLFAEVRQVGITGGEPTLRNDLFQLFEVLCKALPNLQGCSTITNAIQAEAVIKRVEQSAEICRQYDKAFNLMVSLDGVGEVHDANRGRPGNFDSALHVIRHFRDNTDIPITIGCTITSINVWDVDNVLELCEREKVWGRFRVAEHINRLYNEGELDIIRNFSPDEQHHLELFFARLELTYEKNSTIRRTYRSIRKMLSGEAGRTIGCPYQSRGIVLDCRGNVQYCAPKSRILGNALETPASELFQSNLAERRRILRHECSNCIHDYHAPQTFQGLWSDLRERTWKRVIRL